MVSDGSATSAGSGADRFAELCGILLGAERTQLSELKQRLENPETRAQDVAAVLAEAVRLRGGSDPKLRRALQPTIEEAIEVAVRRNPRMLASALFPIFGRAIRKALASELNAMVQSLSQMLEQGFSVRSLKWRLEAWRTRKPYAEIVLLRSLLYRVEQVFLIHRKSGLLLLHAESGSAAVKDPEMVSGMLTAIQDFVRDAISGDGDEDLETVRMGEFTVLLAYGPEMILAGFVRGVIPRRLDQVFQEELETIHEEQAAALSGFSGDTSKFESSRPHLEKCLMGQGEVTARPEGLSRKVRLALVAAPLLLVAALAWWWASSARAERNWRHLVEQIGAQPGIVVTGYGERGGRRFITGFRDPLAAEPGDLASAAGYSAGQVSFRWEPYHSLQPPFAAARRYSDLKRQLERNEVRFRPGSAAIPAEEGRTVHQIARDAASVLETAAAAGRQVRIEVLGSTDASGRAEVNVTLARDRAAAVAAALAESGVRRELMDARGLPPPCGLGEGRDDAACRTAVIRVLEAGRR